jgi:CubicO group peptidase (beta-lactamase class C family)
LDSSQLAGFFANFSQEHFNLDSLLVIRHGYIVAEAYAPPFQQDSLHYLASTTKSFTSALIGILLDQGHIKSLDEPVVSFFPERTIQNLDERKQTMTIRNLLTMTAGLDCDVNTPAYAALDQSWSATEDKLQFVLDLPMASEPGKEFHYCDQVAYLLSAVITQTTGMTARDFAAENLFSPLGITEFVWSDSSEGITLAASELRLSTRDMAKFGYLFLNEGRWEDQQVISADYVKAATSHQLATGWPDTAYGYLWWYADSISAPMTMGGGGQFIRIDPARDIIVVMTAGFNNSLRAALQYPFTYFMAGWTAGDAALAENAGALSQLEGVIAGIQNPQPGTVQPVPEIAGQVAGKNFMMMSPFILDDFSNGYPPAKMTATSIRFGFEDEALAKMAFTFADGQTWVAPIGLNGLYQVAESPVGLMAARGEWHGDNELSVFMKYVGDPHALRMDVVFVPGGIQIFCLEYLDGSGQLATGVMMQ